MATGRSLHLSTLLAERLHGRKAITAGTNTAASLHFTVHALSTNAHLDFKALIGQPALLKLELADVRCSAQASTESAAAHLGCLCSVTPSSRDR